MPKTLTSKTLISIIQEFHTNLWGITDIAQNQKTERKFHL